MVSLNGKFYALGTVFSQEERELVPRVDVYDPINDAWSPSRPMNGHYQGVRKLSRGKKTVSAYHII